MSITVDDQELDWQRWQELEIQDTSLYRDTLLPEDIYHERFDIFLNGLYSVTDGFSNYKKEKKFGGYIAAGHQRLKDALNLMSLQYSAGGTLALLKSFIFTYCIGLKNMQKLAIYII